MKKITVILLCLLLIFSLTLTACSDQNTSADPDDSDSAGTSDLADSSDSADSEKNSDAIPRVRKTLNQLLEELSLQSSEELITKDCSCGDKWSPVDGKWGGPEQEGDAANAGGQRVAAKHICQEGTRSDGSNGYILTVSSDAVSGYHIVGNIYGITSLLKPDMVYQLTVRCRYTPGGNDIEADNMVIRSNSNATYEDPIIINADGEWATYTYSFVTTLDLNENDYLMIGPYNGNSIFGRMAHGAKLEIESVVLSCYGNTAALDALDPFVAQ